MRVSGVVQTPESELVLPPMSPPHAPCSPSIGAVAWPPTLLPTPVDLLRHPFTPYRVTPAGLLSVAGLRHTGVTTRVPPLAGSWGNLPPHGGRGVGKFLWGIIPAAARHAPSHLIIPCCILSHAAQHGMMR